ncbi:MAG: hypothetical protein ACRD4Y_15145 [Candidatus Acidiferrales bacterium]
MGMHLRGAYFVVCLLASSSLSVGAQQARKGQVYRATKPVTVIGNVVAMTREAWMGLDWSLNILLIRVDSIADGKSVPHYVRADFPDHSTYDNSEEANSYRKLVIALRQGGKWKFRLRPPDGAPECWTVPAPPKTGDYSSYGNPEIESVGGARGYPDLNAVRCYALGIADVEEVERKKN